MRRALRLAERAHGRTAPNPMVGCVLVRDGRRVGEGFHRRAGEPHAEVEALRAAGEGARGATAYVTLEPCNHHGRTPPCTDALLAAGVVRVVAAMHDPNPQARGGAERLRAAGVAVEVGLCEEEARAQNAGFLKSLATALPLVTLKAAVTLDGRIATASGEARWVTGEAARREAHRMRDRADAIVVGAGTVRADDPALTTRLPGGRDALRVVLDTMLTTAPTARVVGPGTMIFASMHASRERAEALAARGAEVVHVETAPGPDGRARVQLGAVLRRIALAPALEVLVEGGAAVHGAFLAEGLVDRVAVFIAPKLVGDAGVPLLRLPAGAQPAAMAEAWRLEGVRTRRLGDDVLVTGRLAGRQGAVPDSRTEPR
jgi:diaminohydroxyphosphoribosylaminopyrimidine deaminase/5-amino-6-(5-phosphoribosylamino)uracil reductase